MYINNREEINYHGFLRTVREMQQVSQGCVSKGICTVSAMNRFENGNRIAEKLMRDRLSARLGVAEECFEEYLLPKEYVLWEHRMRILNTIEKQNRKEAWHELADYEARKGLNRVNLQFIEAMRFMLLTIEESAEEELLECIKKAIKYTVPNVKKALDGKHLLADQEVNLIAEYMRLCLPKKVIRDLNSWRISEYEKLIAYIDHSSWEKLQKAKVYPKIVYYICQCLLEKEMTEAEVRQGLRLCHTAIELLRDCSRLYYFIELTEFRRELATRLMKYGLEQGEKEKLQAMLEENDVWENAVKDLYAEYDVKTHMSNFCYLYYETGCYNVVKVIETRRKMLGLSRVKLGAGACSDKTIIRFEREGVNPTIELVRRLFEKLGLCAEYRRAPIVTTDVDALRMYYSDVLKMMNDENGLACIEALKERISMELPYNKQVITRLESIYLYNQRKIGEAEFVQKVLEALEYTIPLSAVVNKKKKFFTLAEMECIQTLAFDVKSEVSETCLQIVEELCLDDAKESLEHYRKATML